MSTTQQLLYKEPTSFENEKALDQLFAFMYQADMHSYGTSSYLIKLSLCVCRHKAHTFTESNRENFRQEAAHIKVASQLVFQKPG